MLLHLFAPASCSDDLAIVCTISHKEPSVNIYVGNLAFTTTDHDLRQLFEPYGAVAICAPRPCCFRRSSATSSFPHKVLMCRLDCLCFPRPLPLPHQA